MPISIIVAMDKHSGIGLNGDLPWTIPEDMYYFKHTTMGKTVIMGRKTFESLLEPLPGRQNVILTRDPEYAAEGAMVFSSFDSLLKTVQGMSFYSTDVEIFIIGGKEIYDLFYPYADRLYVTHVDDVFDVDTWWDTVDWEDWKLIDVRDPSRTSELPYRFAYYERRYPDVI